MLNDPTGLEAVASAKKSFVPLRAKLAAPEFVLTACPWRAEPTGHVWQRLAAELSARSAQPLSVMIFGALEAREEIERGMQAALGEARWPVTFIDGASCDGAPLAGVQVFAVANRQVRCVRLGGRIVGSVYEDDGARYCMLGGIGPTSVSLTRAAQTQQMFGNLEWALGHAGFELSDVMRTWFYNDAILDWYGDFNRVRTAHYSDVEWRTGSLPASTGIGARNAAGAALTLAAWAMKPLEPTARAFEVGSPLQCPAPAYGSSFSRATEIDSGGWRRLLVSGTASIHPGGETAWVDNPKKQVDHTMEVIAAILESRGMSFGDVTRATAYFKRPEFKPLFDAWLTARDLRDMPVVSTHCAVCRDDLLFELELDACVPNQV